MKNFIEELRWRGMLHDMMPQTEEQLQKEVTTAYVGFDPTAASLHIGNLATLMLLVHFQLCGHKPVALVDGATGMIGDPSGKSAERNLLDEATLRHNQACIQKQLEKFLRFDQSNTSAQIVNNYDWFKEIGFLDFLREAGKHLTISYMMAKDSVKNRLETGISYTEFSYQLLQAYDFVHLFKTEGVKLQMGGSDQWGNITSGTELIRRMQLGNVYALTCPLLTKADGSKFGKSEGGNIWLDPQMTSPYKFYQFWLNAADQEAEKLLCVFTLKSQEEIQALVEEHAQDPGRRIMQKALAQDITLRVHGQQAYENALQASSVLFGKDVLPILKTIDERTLLEIFEGVENVALSKDAFASAQDPTELLSVLTDGKIFPSKGEARRMITGGGVSINKVKIDGTESMDAFDLLQNKYMLVQKGKKNYYLLVIA